MVGILEMSGSLPLSELEALVSQHIDDRRFWAIYADALCEAGAPQAPAVQKALEQGAATPGPEWEPHQLEVDWHYGHWRAAHIVGFYLQPQQVLGHPLARFLQHLVLPLRSDLGLQGVVAPSTLERLEVLAADWGEAQGSWPDLSPLGALSEQLRELRAPSVRLEGSSPAPRLVQLEVADLARCPPRGCLPNLEILTLGRLPIELIDWDPSVLPSLRCLQVRDPITAEQLGALLDSALGRALRRLEVVGNDLLPFALENRERWDHLEQLMLDGPGVVERSLPRLVVRHPHDPDEEGNGTCLRLAVPCSRLALRRAIEGGCEQLGLRIEWLDEPSAIGVLIPEEAAFPLARAIAAQTGQRVQVIQQRWDFEPDGAPALSASECSPEGLVRTVKLERSPWSHPTARIWVKPDYDTDRTEIDPELRVVEGDYDTLRAEAEEDPFFSGHEDDGSWEPPEFLGCPAALWVPVDWRPDPFPRTLSLPAWPRRLALEDPGEVLELGAELGAYLCWRAFTTCILEEMPAPDIHRWTVRMLRRHGLSDEPSDPGHPYWADWKQASRAERAGRSSEDKVPSYKLASRGHWLLCGDEARLLASALRTAIPHHRTPPEHADGLASVIRLLGLGQPLEVTVR